MGIDYYSCKFCGEGFSDMSDGYVNCEKCGNRWCDMECAENDGIIIIEDGYSESCKYCRGEDFDTERKLIKALELLKISENELIEIMRKGDKSDV